MRTALKVVSVLAAAGLTVTACGDTSGNSGSDPASSTSDIKVSEEHNAADVEFATGMLPHHAQAIEMAELAEDRAERQEVLDLAEDIRAAQDPEMELLTSMLKTWGEDVPDMDSDMSGGMEGMDHGAAGDNMNEMGGMMSAEDMSALKDASGAEFDEMFLEMMIEHHRGAIEMAQSEQAEGKNPAAIALAEEIESAQTEEITRIEQLLNS